MTELSPVSHLAPLSKVVRGSVGILLANCEAKIVHVETEQVFDVTDLNKLFLRVGVNSAEYFFRHCHLVNRIKENSGSKVQYSILMFVYLMARIRSQCDEGLLASPGGHPPNHR